MRDDTRYRELDDRLEAERERRERVERVGPVFLSEAERKLYEKQVREFFGEPECKPR